MKLRRSRRVLLIRWGSSSKLQRFFPPQGFYDSKRTIADSDLKLGYLAIIGLKLELKLKCDSQYAKLIISLIFHWWNYHEIKDLVKRKIWMGDVQGFTLESRGELGLSSSVLRWACKPSSSPNQGFSTVFFWAWAWLSTSSSLSSQESYDLLGLEWTFEV